MMSFKAFLEAKDDERLFHGTLRDNVPNIKKNWLQPKAGSFTKKFYGDAEPRVHMADDFGLNKVAAALHHHIGHKLGKFMGQVTADDIEKHGAVAIVNMTKHSDHDIHRHDNDGTSTHKRYGYTVHEHPGDSVEPHDYYSKEDVRPSGIIKGKQLVKMMRKRNLIYSEQKKPWEK